jgi:hypothetical protein
MLHDALRYFRHGTYSDAADKSRVRGQMVERSNDWGKRDEEAIALDAKRHMGTGPVWTKEEEVEWGSRKENKGQCLSAKGPKKARQDSAWSREVEVAIQRIRKQCKGTRLRLTVVDINVYKIVSQVDKKGRERKGISESNLQNCLWKCVVEVRKGNGEGNGF